MSGENKRKKYNNNTLESQDSSLGNSTSSVVHLNKRAKENKHPNSFNSFEFSPNHLSSTRIGNMSVSDSESHSNSSPKKVIGININEIINNPNPTTQNVMQGIGYILSMLTEIKSDTNECRNKTDKHENEIAALQLQNNNILNELNDLRAATNIMQQEKIDKDVIISGFPEEFKFNMEEDFITKLCDYYIFNRNLISNFFSFQNFSKKIFIVLTFVDKKSQILFKQTCKQKGPFILGTIQTSNTPTQTSSRDIPLRINNRITKTNQEIIRELRELLEKKQITAIRFRNSCFQYKKNENSAFTSACTLDHINQLKNDLEQEKSQKQ